ncbi:MAG: C-type lectin domain-containing protein, partial [Tannerella sp.]|nr:C-type lectin domain-containing protein [Tannerella sp.]
MGLTGYLATITSSEEQQFIKTVAAGAQGWVAGTRGTITWSGNKISSLSSAGGYWYWAAGPEFDDYGRNSVNSIFYNRNKDASYAGSVLSPNSVNPALSFTAWNTTPEPNDSGTEYCMQLTPTGLWNDLKYDASITNYMVEYRGAMNVLPGKGAVGYGCTKSASPASGTSASPTPIVFGDTITYTIV